MAGQSDAVDCIMAVMHRAFDPTYGEAWNRRQIGDALAMPNTHALLIDPEGNVLSPLDGQSLREPAAGFVLTRTAADEEELLLIAVTPEHRRLGLAEILIGQLFLSARERGVRKIFLEMRRGNPAVFLYEKLGFQPIGERSNYYKTQSGDRIDAITFGREI